ncbi:tail fiber protein [Tistrella mobilis]|uniref:phage tail protein n=1 Tax=Tistrella mobilis TaxID=171437 RepID=UPI003555DB29
MADPFTGEIRVFAFAFAPYDWAYCNGQQMTVQQNQVLYAIIGTQYGGSVPNQTYNLPDLRGRVPVGMGTGLGLTPRSVGQKIGTMTVTLGMTQIASHSHGVNATIQTVTSNITLSPSAAAVIGRAVASAPFGAYPSPVPNPSPVVEMDSRTIGVAGGGQAHENRQPTLAMNFCICTSGYFPVRP